MTPMTPMTPAGDGRLAERVAALEAEVADLRAALDELRSEPSAYG
jgi:uncharacterized protein YceH (UPF0502 family)